MSEGAGSIGVDIEGLLKPAGMGNSIGANNDRLQPEAD